MRTKNKKSPYSEMDRARGARLLLKRGILDGNKQAEMDAFMAIFHPEKKRIIVGGKEPIL